MAGSEELMTSARAHGDDGRVVEDHLLSVRDLKVTFLSRHGTALAVKGVDFDLARGKVLAIVGESGCGKSATAMSLMHLLPRRTARTEGRMLLRGRDIGALAEREMNDVRGKQMAMIFQDPMTSLNPLLRWASSSREADPIASRSRPRRHASGGTSCSRCRNSRAGAARAAIRTSSPAACASGS